MSRGIVAEWFQRYSREVLGVEPSEEAFAVSTFE